MGYLVGAYTQFVTSNSKTSYDKVVSSCVAPLLTYIFNRDEIFANLFFSSNFIDFTEQHRSEINLLIQQLVKYGKIQLLTSAYHQSIFPLLSPKDKAEQVEKMTTSLRNKFGHRPDTIWITGQYWTNTIINALSGYGVDKVIISSWDNVHRRAILDEPCINWELSKSVHLYPTNHSVERAVWEFSEHMISANQLINTIVINRDNRDSTVMLNLDQLCKGNIRKNELDDILNELFRNSLSDFPVPRETNYLPSGWYGLDTDPEGASCIQDFIIKRKHLRYLYNRVTNLEEIAKNYKKDKDNRRYINLLLNKLNSGVAYLNDCNCTCLRSDIYLQYWAIIIELEMLLSSIEEFNVPLIQDVNNDGIDEYMLGGKTINGYVEPATGSLTELKYVPAKINYGTTLWDDENINVFTDKIDGTLITDGFTVMEKDNKLSNIVLEGKKDYIFIEKRFRFRQNVVACTVTLINNSTYSREFTYSSILDLNLMDLSYSESYYLNSMRTDLSESDVYTQENVRTMSLVDRKNNAHISINCELPAMLRIKKHHTEAETINGTEDLYLSTELDFSFKVALKPLERHKLTIYLRIERN